MRERDIENYARKRVASMGGEMRKVKWIGRKAAPDDLVMVPEAWNNRTGTFYGGATFVEFKAPGKQATAAQVREHARMRAFGLRVVVINSLEGVDALLE
jgi:hypothetical protein